MDALKMAEGCGLAWRRGVCLPHVGARRSNDLQRAVEIWERGIFDARRLSEFQGAKATGLVAAMIPDDVARTDLLTE